MARQRVPWVSAKFQQRRQGPWLLQKCSVRASTQPASTQPGVHTTRVHTDPTSVHTAPHVRTAPHIHIAPVRTVPDDHPHSPRQYRPHVCPHRPHVRLHSPPRPHSPRRPHSPGATLRGRRSEAAHLGTPSHRCARAAPAARPGAAGAEGPEGRQPGAPPTREARAGGGSPRVPDRAWAAPTGRGHGPGLRPPWTPGGFRRGGSGWWARAWGRAGGRNNHCILKIKI